MASKDEKKSLENVLNESFQQHQLGIKALTENLNKASEPLIKLSNIIKNYTEEIKKSTQPFSKTLHNVLNESSEQDQYKIQALSENLNKILEPFVNLSNFIKNNSEETKKLTQPFLNTLQNVKDNLSNFLIEHRETLLNFHDTLSKFEPILLEQSKNLAEFGWFYNHHLSIDLNTVTQSLEKAKNNNLDPLNNYMISELSNIENNIKKLFSMHTGRKKVLNMAYNLHMTGNYIASIPLFLIQADGIMREKLLALYRKPKYKFLSIYSKENSGIKLEEYLKDLKESEKLELFSFIFASPLGKDICLNKNSEKAISENEHFNRHAILHGETSEYSSKENSYKALSLLCMTLTINEI